mmetsp:Transcript_39142/g.51200  ORF Transcript_39142/g.51200 Transcript_39142/m.51200 type:complete len:170 (+) Transcript_39142:129-638(+)
MLQEKGLASEQVLNQRIETPMDVEVTLFDLFMNRKYKSGLYFLIYVCKILVEKEKRELAQAIIEDGSSIRSIYENGISLNDKTSKNSNNSVMLSQTPIGRDHVRRINRLDSNFETLQSVKEVGSHTPNKYSKMKVMGELPQLNQQLQSDQRSALGNKMSATPANRQSRV